MQTIKITTTAKLSHTEYGDYIYAAEIGDLKIEFQFDDGPSFEDYDKPFEIEIEIPCGVTRVKE